MYQPVTVTVLLHNSGSGDGREGEERRDKISTQQLDRTRGITRDRRGTRACVQHKAACVLRVCVCGVRVWSPNLFFYCSGVGPPVDFQPNFVGAFWSFCRVSVRYFDGFGVQICGTLHSALSWRSDLRHITQCAQRSSKGSEQEFSGSNCYVRGKNSAVAIAT